MSEYHALFEQVVLYLGAPWKYNNLTDSSYNRYEIVDGSGRKLIFIKEWNHERFKLHGCFPHGFWQSCKSIGFSAKRPPKDIAADIQRRFLSHYSKAFDKAQAECAKRQETEQSLDHIAQCLAKVTGGTVDTYKSSGQRNVYFNNGKVEIYSYSHDIKLTLHHLTPDMAVKLAAFHSQLSRPKKFEVQHFTLCDGWINTWIIGEEGQAEQPQIFDSKEAAQAELDEFFRDIAEEIAYGERDEDDSYDRSEFRIVEVQEDQDYG